MCYNYMLCVRKITRKTWLLTVTFNQYVSRQKLDIPCSSAPCIRLCGRISTATVYEYNNLFLLVLKWRKPLRNHIKRAARKLGRQNLWRIRARKDWLAVCHVPARKRNKCWSFPHWWLISRYTHTHTRSRAPKPATFPASFPRGWPEGKGYSLAVDDGTPVEWKGEELSLPVPVCQFASWVCVLCEGTLSPCLSFWRGSWFPSPVSQYTMQPGTLAGWARLAKHCVVYLRWKSDQWSELESKRTTLV